MNFEEFKTGNWNTGNRNTGNRNSGNRNSGDWNSGDWNSGDRNSGYRNSGYRNSGYRNSGDWNSGDRNTGHLNSGNWNSGNWNSGDCNSGYRNSGVFCNRGREDSIMMFNRDSGMSWDEWMEHPVYHIVCDFSLTEWVDWSDMDEQQRADHPECETTGGYLKTREYKEAWQVLWDGLDDEQRELFKTLPNYDADIFEDITGIRYE